MAAKRAKKKSSAVPKSPAVGKKKAVAKAEKKPAFAKATKKAVATKRVKAGSTKKVSAKSARARVDVAKKPQRPAKANKAPPVPHEKTIDMTEAPPPPKPKATISRAKAVALANTYLKEHVGKAELYAPRASRFRLGSIVDRGGTINICFCHEADDFDPVITTLGAKCLESLVTAHPQLKAFELEVQTIRM